MVSLRVVLEIETWYFLSTDTTSDVPARLGPKALALAWPEAALAFLRSGPSQSHHERLGPGPARPKPWLLTEKVQILQILQYVQWRTS